MKRQLDIENWNRKSHFEFFSQFDEPFFGVCVEVDCTTAYARCKEEGISFFIYYLYESLVAANKTEPFRYRIKDDQVYVYDEVHASATINRPDGTFGFSYMSYCKDFSEFQAEAGEEINNVRNTEGLIPAVSGENVIHFSALPWLNFTSLSHARNFSFNDSCPKISFGKMMTKGDAQKMPVSVHVHHALMDGYHVGKFFDTFQNLMDTAD